ncbi:hypothetical protein RDABS01_020958 [Bienertia sinuspersici]
MISTDSPLSNADHNDLILSSLSCVSLTREPSFSGWCDLNYHLEAVNRPIEQEELIDDFELPFESQNQGMEKHGDFERDNDDDDDGRRIGNQSYVPFNVEDDDHKGMGERTQTFQDSKTELSPANVLKTLFFICVWYTFSLFLTLYNKSLLGDHMGKFPAPLLMNTFHFAMQAVLSKAITWIWYERFHKGLRMSWRDYFSKVFPTALATALDVNLSNASLVFISVTFATMVRPIYLNLIVNQQLLYFFLSLLLLSVAKETEFEFWGFIFVMLAAVMSGFRWCMTQILLQAAELHMQNTSAPLLSLSSVALLSCFMCVFSWILSSFVWLANMLIRFSNFCCCKKPRCQNIAAFLGLKNPLTFMSYVTPIMALATGVMSLFLDPWHEFPQNEYFNSSWHITRSCLLMLFGGTLAFFMVLTEYVLISVTSAVTVTIAGVVKEAVTILVCTFPGTLSLVVAVFYFHDEFTWLKGIGLTIIIFGVSLFNWYK